MELFSFLFLTMHTRMPHVGNLTSSENIAPNFGAETLKLRNNICLQGKRKWRQHFDFVWKDSGSLRRWRNQDVEEVDTKSEDKSLASLSENQLRQPKMSKRSKTRLDEGKNSTSLNILKVKGKSTKSKTNISRRPVTENWRMKA